MLHGGHHGSHSSIACMPSFGLVSSNICYFCSSSRYYTARQREESLACQSQVLIIWYQLYRERETHTHEKYIAWLAALTSPKLVYFTCVLPFVFVSFRIFLYQRAQSNMRIRELVYLSSLLSFCIYYFHHASVSLSKGTPCNRSPLGIPQGSDDVAKTNIVVYLRLMGPLGIRQLHWFTEAVKNCPYLKIIIVIFQKWMVHLWTHPTTTVYQNKLIRWAPYEVCL